MSRFKRGNELPEGTIVYIYCDTEITRCIQISHDLQWCAIHFTYEFGDDGLWATPYLRKVWREHPRFHPQCTLFDRLYKKLKL